MDTQVKWQQDLPEFFQLISLLMQGYDKIRAACQAGDYDKAAAAYVAKLKEKFKALPFERRDNSDEDTLRQADALLCNRVSLLGTPPQFVGDPINWAYYQNDMQWQSHLGYMYFPVHLIQAFRLTGNRAYLRKWREIILSFIADHPYGCKEQTYSTQLPMYASEYMPITGGEGFLPGYVGGSWISLACAARTDNIMNGLSGVIEEGVLTDAEVCAVVRMLMADNLTVMLANPRRGTPNQFLHVSMSIVKLSVFFSEFKIASAGYLTGMQYLEQAVGMYLLPDGSDCEQSFNYNANLPVSFHRLSGFPMLQGHLRMTALQKQVEKRCEFLALITSPLCQYPDLAKGHGQPVDGQLERLHGMYGLPLLAAVIDRLKGRETTYPLPKTVHFPYGGYSVFRSGWSKDDVYLFTKYSRYAPGHKHEDVHGVTLTAYGSNLLVDTGNFNYSQDAESQKINAYCLSTKAHNTITIDGKSQVRTARFDKHTKVDERLVNSPNLREYEKLSDIMRLHNEEATPARHGGVHFDAVVGVYDDGFEDVAATHRRETVFCKPGCFVLIDRLSVPDGGTHRFCHHWHFAPAFSPEHVLIEGERIVTKRPGGANVFLQTFPISGAGLCFQQYHGDKDACRGFYVVGYDVRVPAVDVDAGYDGTGDQILLSLIFPFADEGTDMRTTRRESGFEAAFGGNTLICTADANQTVICYNKAHLVIGRKEIRERP